MSSALAKNWGDAENGESLRLMFGVWTAVCFQKTSVNTFSQYLRW